MLDYRARGISSIPAAVVDDEGNALTTDIYSALTLQESLQLDYANVALDHLNSLEPATRRLLKIALDVDHLYMESPDGVPKWKTTQEGRPAALHCLGSIYGLKQSSFLLHSRLAAFLQTHGYVPLVGDPCV